MRRLPWHRVGLVLLSASCAPRAAPGTDPFTPDALTTSEYNGKDELVLAVDGMPTKTDRDESARVLAAWIPGKRLRLSLIDSADGEPLCTLSARVTGTSAILDPNQLCFGGRTTRTLFRKGHAEFQGSHLELDLSAMVEIETGDVLVDGTATYHFEGEAREAIEPVVSTPLAR